MPKTTSNTNPASTRAANPAQPSGTTSSTETASPTGSANSEVAGAADPFVDAAPARQPTPPGTDDPASREERVRRAAYDAYVRRGDGAGDDVQDWLDAEAQVDGRKS